MWKEAVLLLRDAQDVSTKGQEQHRGPDVVTFSAAVAACRNAGEWQQALSLMEVMNADFIVLEPAKLAIHLVFASFACRLEARTVVFAGCCHLHTLLLAGFSASRGWMRFCVLLRVSMLPS